jgi:endonuclease/exonuclease/phosphatase (EEP) superfamily protein YafD
MRSLMAEKILRWLEPLVVLAALGLCAATLAALAAEAWWGFELFTHFRLHYVALLLPLAAALAMLGRRRFAAVLALAAVANVWPLLPYLPGAPSAHAVAGKATLELMAVNVEWKNGSSERLLEMIRAESPDAVLVVEYTHDWAERLAPIFGEYPHRVLLPAEHAFGLALLSRLPLRDVRPFKLESTDAIDALIVAPGGDLRLIGVHLRPPTAAAWAAERARQLDALAVLVKEAEGPLAIAGDFNLTPYSPYFMDWLRRTGLRDARAGSGFGFSWPTFLPVLGIPIDHCIVSPELGVAAFRRLPAFGSDHYPIVVELIMEGEQ